MQQLLLTISDSSKANKLISLLRTLNYVKIEPYTEENIVVTESEINPSAPLDLHREAATKLIQRLFW